MLPKESTNSVSHVQFHTTNSNSNSHEKNLCLFLKNVLLLYQSFFFFFSSSLSLSLHIFENFVTFDKYVIQRHLKMPLTKLTAKTKTLGKEIKRT